MSDSKKRTGKRTTKPARGAKRLAIYLRDDLKCIYCARPAHQVVCLTLDHVTPWVNGGSNHESNLVTCCDRCNSSLQDSSLSEGVRRLNENFGLDIKVSTVRSRIKRQTARDLAPYRRTAKAIMAGLLDDPRPAHIGAAKGSPEWRAARARIKGASSK